MNIGPYIISMFSATAFWIQHKSGEGMEISKEKLITWLDELWAKEF